MRMILSSCPIHRACTIEVFFGEEVDGRIPFPIRPSSAMQTATIQT